MKLLTLNTHSIVEENYEEKLKIFIDTITEEKPDVIAMQEVNQSILSHTICTCHIENLVLNQSPVKIKRDNHALRVASMLDKRGEKYFWTWMPLKVGYGLYDEGLALFSRFPIEDVDWFLISGIDNYYNWKTRKVLGIKSNSQWFYTVHMGWWRDEDDPFKEQWKRLQDNINSKEKVWLMGDFNSRSDIKGEGYDLISSSGWIDTYKVAEDKDDGFTACTNIDGWKKNLETERKIRIDYIWCGFNQKIKSSKVIFNGTNKDIVSDHFGVLIETIE